MLVSIIVPTYNRRAFLPRALDSIVRQTVRTWELIVVDDGSTDGTESLWHDWRAKQAAGLQLHYWRTPNQGVSAARNFGARKAQGDWLAFLDSDDEWLEDKLQRQLLLNFELIHGEEIWVRNGVRVNPKQKHAKAGGRIFLRCVDLCCISPSTVMMKRTLFEHYGGFREDFTVCEDYELWLRICADRTVGFVPQPVLLKYGGHIDQLSNRPAMDFYRVKALLPLLEKTDLAEREYVAQTIVRKCEILAKGFIKHGHMSKAAQVQDWQRVARNFLTQFHSTHSAAERLPRSVDTFTL